SDLPIYRGHGLPPEELLKANPAQWWDDVEQAFEHLRNLGYEEIAVCGLSLGGVLGLKLAFSEKVKGVIPMCTPMFFDNETQLTQGFKQFASEYKQLQEKDEETIKEEVATLMDSSGSLFEQIGAFINDVNSQVDTIYTPTFVVQARKDEMIN